MPISWVPALMDSSSQAICLYALPLSQIIWTLDWEAMVCHHADPTPRWQGSWGWVL